MVELGNTPVPIAAADGSVSGEGVGVGEDEA